MTVDDLAEVYDAAVSKRYIEWVNAPEGSDHLTNDILRRAGIRAIVRALRDDFVTAAVSGVALAAHVNAGTAKPGAVERIADSVINEILGDAGEKVAEPTAGQRLIKAAKEAAAIARGEVPDAAPAVCVWIDQVKGMAWAGCDNKLYPIKSAVNGCNGCGAPVKFTEAK